MSNCCFCNFIKRSFLYQILIIIAALKLRNAFRYNREFVQRIGEFLTSINISEDWLNYLPKNKEYTHKGFLIALIVFASFSILSIRFLNFFKILSGIGCLLLGFLYHNPIPKFKQVLAKKEPCSWTKFEQNLPEMEFILYVCLAFAMFANAFCPGTCEKEKQDKQEEKTIVITKEEITEPEKPKKGKKEPAKNKNENKVNKKQSKKKKE